MGSVCVAARGVSLRSVLATVAVARAGVGSEVHSLWAKLRSRPQLCSFEDKQTEVNPYHGVSKGILACGGKGTLLKGRREQSVVRIRKKEVSEGCGQKYTRRAEIVRRDSAERRR